MPYPNQTNREAIIRTAYSLIERDGIEQLTLGHLAQALHIKAPSLYRHVASRAVLIQLINTTTIESLFDAYAQAVHNSSVDPFEQLRVMMHAHRAFALAHPITYVLAFTTAGTVERPAEQLLEGLAQPIHALMAAISGPEHALAALRGALALIHGFVMLEINQQLRRGGDLTDAFTRSIDAYLRGWQIAVLPVGFYTDQPELIDQTAQLE
jgi:AcrR family transcriptional regulator